MCSMAYALHLFFFFLYCIVKLRSKFSFINARVFLLCFLLVNVIRIHTTLDVALVTLLFFMESNAHEEIRPITIFSQWNILNFYNDHVFISMLEGGCLCSPPHLKNCVVSFQSKTWYVNHTWWIYTPKKHFIKQYKNITSGQ